jgi:hypothetical protein
MTYLDPYEKAAVEEFLAILKDELVEAKASPQPSQIWRGSEGQIILPVSADADRPSLTLALLAAQKAEGLYKATSTRIQCVQRPLKDPHGFTYVWKDEVWSTLSRTSRPESSGKP